MAQFVIEFGAPTLDPVFAALLSVIDCPTFIEMELRSGGSEQCPASKDALESVRKKFAEREIVSATFRADSEDVRYGLILEPRYNGQHLSMWMGTVELVSEKWRQYWDALLRLEGLSFACVGEEEGVELTDERLTVASFPWEEWPILVGALRTPEGGSDWVIRQQVHVRSEGRTS
jgi:hypothetical protein